MSFMEYFYDYWSKAFRSEVNQFHSWSKFGWLFSWTTWVLHFQRVFGSNHILWCLPKNTVVNFSQIKNYNQGEILPGRIFKMWKKCI